MKKVLLASTVLAMTATVAAAEGVTVTGNARMGLIYDGNTVGPNTSKAKFTSRVRIVFTAAGETDGGLSFGASVRNDQSGQGNTANGDSTVFISGAFGKLTFGDNDSAANVLVGHVDAKSLTGLGDNNELGYLGQSDTSVLYTYSAGALSFAASVGQRNIAAAPAIADEAMSVAVKYSTDAFNVSLGYEDTATDDQLSIGLGASYDLGGGASLVGGIQKVKGSKAVADFGVSMKF